MIFEGRVHTVGDHVGATDIVPARYDRQGMSKQWDACAKHVFEDLDATIATRVRPGDLLVAGRQLGSGHAHYYMTAIQGSVAAGFAALLADSIGALFLRAAIDAGVPAWAVPGISELVGTGDLLHIDLGRGHARNTTTGQDLQFPPVSGVVLDILDAGGSSAWALRRVRTADGAGRG